MKLKLNQTPSGSVVLTIGNTQYKPGIRYRTGLRNDFSTFLNYCISHIENLHSVSNEPGYLTDLQVSKFLSVKDNKKLATAAYINAIKINALKNPHLAELAGRYLKKPGHAVKFFNTSTAFSDPYDIFTNSAQARHGQKQIDKIMGARNVILDCNPAYMAFSVCFYEHFEEFLFDILTEFT